MTRRRAYLPFADATNTSREPAILLRNRRLGYCAWFALPETDPPPPGPARTSGHGDEGTFPARLRI